MFCDANILIHEINSDAQKRALHKLTVTNKTKFTCKQLSDEKCANKIRQYYPSSI